MKNYRVVWSNIVTMYLVQIVVCLLLMNMLGWQYGSSSIISGILVGASFGLFDVPIFVKKDK